jgi:hypothetical protein
MECAVTMPQSWPPRVCLADRRRGPSPFNAPSNRSTLKNRHSMDYASVIFGSHAIVPHVCPLPTVSQLRLSRCAHPAR